MRWLGDRERKALHSAAVDLYRIRDLPAFSLEEPFALTGREAEVMAWVAQGKSNVEVARIVQAQPRTIEKHLERIYKKLGVDNRFAAILAVMSQTDRS